MIIDAVVIKTNIFEGSLYIFTAGFSILFVIAFWTYILRAVKQTSMSMSIFNWVLTFH